MTIAPAALPNHLTFTLSFNKHSSFEVLNTPIIDTYTIYTGYIHLEYTRFYRDELSHKLATIISFCSQRFVTVSANYISPSSSHSLNLTSPHVIFNVLFHGMLSASFPVSIQPVSRMRTHDAQCIMHYNDNNNKNTAITTTRCYKIWANAICRFFPGVFA